MKESTLESKASIARAIDFRSLDCSLPSDTYRSEAPPRYAAAKRFLSAILT
jgi:hypothetical protein